MAAARIDERGRISGGKDGDQTGEEVMVQRYSNFRINCVLRYTGTDTYYIRNRIVRSAVGIATNNKIGYNQLRRTTSFSEIKKLGWKLKAIPKMGLCATDCSEMAAICVNIAFLKEVVPSWNYTGNQKANMRKLGFSDVTGAVNLQTGEGLLPGDILLRESGHTAIYIGSSKKGTRYVKSYMVSRTRYLYPHAKKDKSARITKLEKGQVLQYLHEKKGNWRKVKIGKKTGWVHNGGVTKAIKVRDYC